MIRATAIISKLHVAGRRRYVWHLTNDKLTVSGKNQYRSKTNCETALRGYAEKLGITIINDEIVE